MIMIFNEAHVKVLLIFNANDGRQDIDGKFIKIDNRPALHKGSSLLYNVFARLVPPHLGWRRK